MIFIREQKINQLTETVNKILQVSNSKMTDTGHFFETLAARNRMLSTEIGNLILTFTLEKVNVINPAIVYHSDHPTILTDQVTGTSITDILKVSNIKVHSKDYVINVIIQFPIISKL